MTPVSVSSSQLILLAEDDVLIRNFVRSCLERRTYKVLVAADGKEAIELAGKYQGTIDLFLTDVDMPFLDGVAAYREINVQRPGIKVLFMSGGMNRSHQLEQWPFLPKPFEMGALFGRVEEILTGHNHKSRG